MLLSLASASASGTVGFRLHLRLCETLLEERGVVVMGSVFVEGNILVLGLFLVLGCVLLAFGSGFCFVVIRVRLLALAFRCCKLLVRVIVCSFFFSPFSFFLCSLFHLAVSFVLMSNLCSRLSLLFFPSEDIRADITDRSKCQTQFFQRRWNARLGEKGGV